MKLEMFLCQEISIQSLVRNDSFDGFKRTASHDSGKVSYYGCTGGQLISTQVLSFEFSRFRDSSYS